MNLRIRTTIFKIAYSNSASVAQLVERLAVNQLVAGSSPARGVAGSIGPVAQSGFRALDS